MSPCRPSHVTNITGANEMTIVQFIRDHRNLKYFMRSGATLQWQVINLKETFGAFKRKAQGLVSMAFEDLFPPTLQFANDISDAFTTRAS